MAIHEHLPRIPKSELKLMGWTKARELVKVVRTNGRDFDCAPWVHKAMELPREEFKREVERHLTGQEIEPWDILYFKAYKSQLPLIERALETAALMLGTDKSRGYCLEMICADFLAGANLEGGDPGVLLLSLERLFRLLPFPQVVRRERLSRSGRKPARLGAIPPFCFCPSETLILPDRCASPKKVLSGAV